MAENLEKKEEMKKVSTKKETAKKDSKTTTKRKITAKKTETKKEETAVNTRKATTKKKENEEKSSTRIDELTQLVEKVEEETRKQARVKNKKENTRNDEVKTDTKTTRENENSKSKDLAVKKDEKEIMINPDKLEKIEEEIKKQTTISDEKKNKINKTIFHNIAIANIIMLYFIFLILGYQTILPEKFMIDLQVFSIITIGLAIVVFEKAYKKDSSEYAIHGIETLFLAIVTLISTYIFSKYQEKFAYIMIIICYLFAIYYVAKSIIIYLKMRTKALKRTNDIHKIVKK